jgi:hypothetical protein
MKLDEYLVNEPFQTHPQDPHIPLPFYPPSWARRQRVQLQLRSDRSRRRARMIRNDPCGQ